MILLAQSIKMTIKIYNFIYFNKIMAEIFPGSVMKKTETNNKDIKSNNIYDIVELIGLSISLFEKNRENFFKNLENMLVGIEVDSIIILQSGEDIPRNDTDVVNYHFQQESNFYYLTGVTEPKFYAILDYKFKKTKLYYFIDKDERNNIFMKLPSLEELSRKYNIEVLDLDLLMNDIRIRDPKKIYLLSGVNSDSQTSIEPAKLNFELAYNYLKERLDYNTLIYEILADTRTKKTPQEIEFMQYLVESTVKAHVATIKKVKTGQYERSTEMEFMCYMRSNHHARSLSYQPICGCGSNSSTLHYINNDQVLKDGQLMLIDMGIRLGGYCSDVTSTIPVNGKFSTTQKNIYDIVLNSNRAVIDKLKPGVYWPDMHLLAESVILKGLIDMKILNDFPLDELLDKRICYYFMPHGLGHFLGLEVHDVGGYLSFTPPRSDKQGLKQLRTSRYLSQGNVITVEPGIYFIPFLLDGALKDEIVKKYFNESELKKYYEFGGVRIEDDVLITISGCINLSGNLARRTEEIEKLMSGINC